ncbi:site-2 protease family protein [Bacteroides sp.]|uniref:site-2 protease family protein n=1 Tax=Bacteroides sp. TaxID=29523 RepID=UPI0026330696|nr:site-2 protease family protein [Bacteroides sp.]
MKRLIKLILGIMIGFSLGFAGVIAGITLFSDASFPEILKKTVSIDILTMLGIILTSFASFFIALFLQIILHEGGHLVCGLATGYTFVSFRIGNLTLIRKDGKFLFKRFSIAGTGGQCLLAPPHKPLNEIPTAWYNMGGVLFNFLSATIALIPIFCISGMPSYVVTFLVIFSLAGYFLALMNGIPLKIGGIGNDADNMRLLLKNTESKQALMTQLQVNALLQEGVRLKDMPAEWFQEEENTNYKDALQVSIRLMTASRYEDMGDMNKAYILFNDCMQHKDELIGLFVKEVSCELLLIALMKGYTEQVNILYTEDIKAYINQYKKVMSGKQVLLCALALYKEDDKAKAKEIYETLCRQSDKYLMQGEVQMSIAFMQSMLTAENVL